MVLGVSIICREIHGLGSVCICFQDREFISRGGFSKKNAPEVQSASIHFSREPSQQSASDV